MHHARPGGCSDNNEVPKVGRVAGVDPVWHAVREVPYARAMGHETDHRDQAESLLAGMRQPSGEPVKHRRSHEETANVLREAQVHATLALVDALDKIGRRGEVD